MDLRRFRLSESDNFMKRRSYNIASMHPVCVCMQTGQLLHPAHPPPPIANVTTVPHRERRHHQKNIIYISMREAPFYHFYLFGGLYSGHRPSPAKGIIWNSENMYCKTYLPLNLAGHGSSPGIRNPPSTFLNESWVRFSWLSSNILEDMSSVTMHMCIYL